MTIGFFKRTNEWFSSDETYFIADKGYDTKYINNFVHYNLNGYVFIPLNPRNSEELPSSIVLCDVSFATHKYVKKYFNDKITQKFCYLFKTKKNNFSCLCKHPKYFNNKKIVAVLNILQLVLTTVLPSIDILSFLSKSMFGR